jgi:DNA primase
VQETFPSELIERVRRGTDLVEIVSEHLSLRKAGQNYLGLCPFHHEKTPSFTVSQAKQLYYCFGCGAGGDVFSFLERQEQIAFPEALRRLAQRAGVALPAPSPTQRGAGEQRERERQALYAVLERAAALFRRNLLEHPEGARARAYLRERGIAPETEEAFGLGYALPTWNDLERRLRKEGCPVERLQQAGLIQASETGGRYYDRFRGRLLFPIRDPSGRVIAFGGRVLGEGQPKYLNSPETPVFQKGQCLYGLDRAKETIRRMGYGIVVEGYLDALMAHQHGFPHAVATLGTALTADHVRLLHRFAPKITLLFDADPAGVRAALRGLDPIVSEGMRVHVALLPEGDDPDSFLRRAGRGALEERLRGSIPLVEFILQTHLQGQESAAVGDRIDRLERVLPVLARVTHPIERGHYVKQVAERLHIDESDIRDALRQREGKDTARRAPEGSPASPLRGREEPVAAEETLLHLMVQREELLLRAARELTPEEFSHPPFRRMVERLFAQLRQEGRWSPGAFCAAYPDAETQQLLARYQLKPLVGEEVERAFQDCVAALKIARIDRQFREASAAQDLVRMNQLYKERYAWHKKKS